MLYCLYGTRADFQDITYAIVLGAWGYENYKTSKYVPLFHMGITL